MGIKKRRRENSTEELFAFPLGWLSEHSQAGASSPRRFGHDFICFIFIFFYLDTSHMRTTLLAICSELLARLYKGGG